MQNQQVNSQDISNNNNAKTFQDINAQPPYFLQAQPNIIPQATQTTYTTPNASIPTTTIPTTTQTIYTTPNASIPTPTTIPTSTIPTTTIPATTIPTSTIPTTTIPATSQPEHHLTSHQMHPTLPILPHSEKRVRLLKFRTVETVNTSPWEGVHPIYDESGNVVYEARGGGKGSAHTLVNHAGQIVVTATGSTSRIMMMIHTLNGETVTADYHRQHITRRRTLTSGGVLYSCGHDAYDGKSGHSWSLDSATDPLMMEEGSHLHNEWRMHIFPGCSEALEKAFVMVTLYERHVVA